LKLIKKLQECSTIGQADPILTKLGAGPAVKKLVETAIILSNSQDPQQRTHAFSFMETAIKELEDDKLNEEEMGKHGDEDGLNNSKINEEENEDDKNKLNEENKDGSENKIHEEELKNHNNGPREEGSEQSTDNTEPYPGTASDSPNGEKPMQDMSGTENQWNETGGMPPPGVMPPAGGMPGREMPQTGNGMIVPSLPPATGPGLAPDIAQEMGIGMPQIPPMDTSQMMKQMQYTINDYHKRFVQPMSRLIVQQKEALSQQKVAIKSLSQEVRETKAAGGTLKLDLDYMRKNSSAQFRETEPTLEKNYPSFDSHGMPGIQPIPRQQLKLSAARSEIEMMDKLLNSKNKPMYS
jgi:hypothetical protein